MIADIEDGFTDIARSLLQNQIDFDILDAQAIQKSEIIDSSMKINNEKYKIFVLPPTDTISIKTAISG